jgi:hypothetical protein
MIHVVTLAALTTKIRIEHGYSEEAARQFDRKVMLTVGTVYLLFNICLISFIWLRNT